MKMSQMKLDRKRFPTEVQARDLDESLCGVCPMTEWLTRASDISGQGVLFAEIK